MLQTRPFKTRKWRKTTSTPRFASHLLLKRVNRQIKRGQKLDSSEGYFRWGNLQNNSAKKIYYENDITHVSCTNIPSHNRSSMHVFEIKLSSTKTFTNPPDYNVGMHAYAYWWITLLPYISPRQTALLHFQRVYSPNTPVNTDFEKNSEGKITLLKRRSEIECNYLLIRINPT